MALTPLATNAGLFSYRNYVFVQSALSASSEAAGLPVQNLAVPHVAQVWSTASGVNSANVIVDFEQSRSIGMVALFGVNFTAGATIRIGLSTADATGAARDALDSGTISANVDPNFGRSIHIFQAASGRYLRLDLEDVSLSELEVGVLWAGPVIQPGRSYSFGRERGYADASVITRNRGGQAFIDEYRPARRLRLTWEFLSATEGWQFEEVGRLNGTRSPVVVCTAPLATPVDRETVYGMLEAVPAVRWDYSDFHSATLEILERR